MKISKITTITSQEIPNSKSQKNITTLSTKRLKSIQGISKKVKEKYNYLQKFKEKTLTFQLSESTDMAKICFILNSLSRLDQPISVDKIYGQLATKTAQKFCDIQFQKDILSKKCQDSCFFHIQFFKFIKYIIHNHTSPSYNPTNWQIHY